jgi:hypothetical protein
MEERMPLLVAGMLFLLGALAHLSRLVFGWSIVLAGWEVPVWLSAVGLAVGLALAIWMWKASRRDSKLVPPWER